ncbi:bifunctional diguanylate cyclase/phosphodiesterase [Paenibacillus endoradicis]|uniref:bifunctional diguanylate cyclase/phosphodiesterase n=1 Tax=Paenibacillus endoradicis TaxID=2972487 RepID=UPI0021591D68|nr:bifunctional diguanylate cyclase/phosphodiesterase [Paenibacillus endoradicis]MCR8659999.1 EAL domain-containing protein [Paenibacillus endoradicis]
MVVLLGSYNGWIVALSFAIAFFTSYQALGLSKKVTSTSGFINWGWLLVSGLVMGCGIWTMHFVGMIAFHLPMKVEYNFFKSSISVIASILASLLAFYVTGTKVSHVKLILSSLLMASGIVTMHYVGMSSMKTDIMTISYDPILWTISVLIAAVASYVSLRLFVEMKRNYNNILMKSVSAIMMAVAVTGMHYVGMEASSFWCIDPQFITSTSIENAPTNLLIIVSVVIVLLVLLTWLAQFWEQAMFRKMAYTDSLTGLSNRHAMNEFFRNTPLQHRRMAILFIDLDQFKYINDTLGHDFGDVLIQNMGERLRKNSLDKNFVFRIGGDEFMLVITYVDKNEVITFVEGLLADIRKPFLINNHRLEVTGSIGISYSNEHGDTKDSLLKAADTAMYYAKNSGKNQFREYNDDMAMKISRRMDIEKGMREALIHKNFELNYQPKWNTATNRPIGFEALLRYTHPQLGVITPNEFIPIAEETGIIVAMSEWVLERACLDCVEWNKENRAEYVVSVNLSIKLIESNMLHGITKRALEISGLNPTLLELEITEQMIMNCGEDVNQQIAPLQLLGVNLSMDNFGSGYSFLGSIDQLSFQTIKIDKEYIENFELPTKRAILNTMISLANSLNIQLIAEGVETKKQIDFLTEAGCHLMQGYYIKKPMPFHEVDPWLKEL